MNDDQPPDSKHHLKYYRPGDLSHGWQFDELAVIVDRSKDHHASPLDATSALEYYNAYRYISSVEHPESMFPSDSDRQNVAQRLMSLTSRFFQNLTANDIPGAVSELPREYFEDLLELFAKHRVFRRCPAEPMLTALRDCHIGLATMLVSKELVTAYDTDVRQLFMSSPRNAELLLRKYFEASQEKPLHLPTSLAVADQRSLIASYVESEGAHPSYLQLLSTVGVPHAMSGVDARLKIKAKRKYDQWLEDFFSTNEGLVSSCEVRLADQLETHVFESQDGGLSGTVTYSRTWLAETLDDASIMNNFLYVFEFVDPRMMLIFPSFANEMGTIEGLIGVRGSRDYSIGAAFRYKESLGLLQVAMYERFLRDHDRSIEQTLTWFYKEFAPAEYAIPEQSFVASSSTATYLERCRHLFSEMESLGRQYDLLATDGEIDRGLLAMMADQVRFSEVPSVNQSKYAYASHPTINKVLHLLFSDQSSLNYVDENLRSESAARLLATHNVRYDRFLEYQRPAIDFLLAEGVLTVASDESVRLTSSALHAVLHQLFSVGAINIGHLSDSAKTVAEQLLARGWLVTEKKLLSRAEGDYFDYYLNRRKFDNGPNLRNSYAHGSHVDPSDEQEHLRTYYTALRLLMCWTLKVNDDLWLKAKGSE